MTITEQGPSTPPAIWCALLLWGLVLVLTVSAGRIGVWDLTPPPTAPESAPLGFFEPEGVCEPEPASPPLAEPSFYELDGVCEPEAKVPSFFELCPCHCGRCFCDDAPPRRGAHPTDCYKWLRWGSP